MGIILVLIFLAICIHVKTSTSALVCHMPVLCLVSSRAYYGSKSIQLYDTAEIQWNVDSGDITKRLPVIVGT